MSKISEIDLGSSLLSIFILMGFIATGFASVRISIIGINYVKANYFKKEEKEEIKNKKEGTKGF